MPLHKFLSLLSLMIGTAGILLVSKAALMTPKEMLRTAYHHGPIGWPSKEIIESMASPKADVTISIVVIIAAFAIQLLSIFADERTPFVESKVHCVLLATAFAAVSSLLLFLVHKGIYRHTVRQAECLEVGDYLQRGLLDELAKPTLSVTELKVEFDGLQHIVRQYFGVERGNAESASQFVARIAQMVECQLPAELDLAKLDKNLSP